MELRISSATSKLLTVTAVSFAIVGLLQFARLREFQTSLTGFIELPVAMAITLVILIWLGLGRYHFLLRLSFAVLALTCLFFLQCFDWLVSDGAGLDEFWWYSFLGGSTTTVLVYGFPIPLVSVTLPLCIVRLCRVRSGSDDHPVARLTIRGLLASTASVGVTMALILGISPYPTWPVEYVFESISFLAMSELIIILVVLPGLSNTAIAYLALVFQEQATSFVSYRGGSHHHRVTGHCYRLLCGHRVYLGQSDVRLGGSDADRPAHGTDDHSGLRCSRHDRRVVGREAASNVIMYGALV